MTPINRTVLARLSCAGLCGWCTMIFFHSVRDRNQIWARMANRGRVGYAGIFGSKQSDEHRKGRPMIFNGGRMTFVWMALTAVAIVQITFVVAGLLGWLG